MKSRQHDALRLDVQLFAREEASIGGRWPLASLPRLASSVVDTPPDAVVAWHAQGQVQPVTAGMTDASLQLHADAVVRLQCQRCLEALDARLEIDRLFRFARDEAAAQELDAEFEDDVLALTAALDLRSLVEDELLLALPLVPRHEHCRPPLTDDFEAEPVASAAANPFAELAVLKAKRPGR